MTRPRHRPRHLPTAALLGLLAGLGAAPAHADPVDFAALFKQAQAYHESVAEAQARLQQSQHARTKVLASLRPTLSVEGTVTRRPETLTASSFILRPQETRDLTVKLSQTLFTGGRATTELKIANIDEASKEIGVAVAREDLVYNLAQAYFDVLKAEGDLAAVKDRRDGMEHHLKAAEARVRLGADVRASALRLEAEVARLKAEEMGDEHAVETARENLANLSGAPEDIQLGAPPDMKAILALDDPLDAALSQRADVRLLSGEEAAARLGIRYTRGNFLPLIKIEGDYQRHAEDPQSSFFIDEETFATLKATWDIYSGGEDLAERHRTRAVYEEKQLSLEQLKRDVKTQVEQAARQVRVAQQIVDSLEEALRYATENHRIVTETYKAGAATYLDVIDASTALGDSQRDLENARHDHSLALLNLARATGRLMTLADEPLPSYARLLERVQEAY